MDENKEIEEMLEREFRGYKVKDLVMAAFLIEKAKVMPEDIRKFEKAFSAGIEYMQKVYTSALGYAFRELIDEEGCSYPIPKDTM